MVSLSITDKPIKSLFSNISQKIYKHKVLGPSLLIAIKLNKLPCKFMEIV